MDRTVLRRIVGGAPAAILVLAGLWVLTEMWPVKHPITLRWVGWTNQGPTRLAQLTLSNVSSARVWINANGRGEPQIDVLQFGLRKQDDGAENRKYSKLTANVYMGWGMLLKPAEALEFTIPWQDPFTNAAVSLSYLPEPGYLQQVVRGMSLWLTGSHNPAWGKTPLEAPWMTWRQRRGSPRGANDEPR